MKKKVNSIISEFIMQPAEIKKPSPGREEPSLILMGLAMFTLMVLPNSSDSFCRTQRRTDINHISEED